MANDYLVSIRDREVVKSMDIQDKGRFLRFYGGSFSHAAIYPHYQTEHLEYNGKNPG